MRYLLHLGFVALLGSLSLGCARQTLRSAPEAWERSFGGTLPICDDEQRRATSVRARILCKPDRVNARIAVLACPLPAAYSWPDGGIFVTEGLMALLDDEQLAAAIAHEAGHLLRDRRPGGVASLRGRHTALAPEAEADALGVELLKAAGLRPQAMVEMLQKVCDASDLAPQYGEEMRRRIEQLRRDERPD